MIANDPSPARTGLAHWTLKFKNFREDLSKSFRHLRPAFELVWEADQRSTLLMGALTLIGAVLPVSQAYVGKLIVDSVLFTIGKHMAPRAGLWHTLPFLGLEFTLLLISVVVGQFRRWAEENLDHKLSYLINTKIIRKAIRLDLHYFENSEFYDKMQNARKQSEYRAVAIMNAAFLLIQNTLTLGTFGALIFAFNPWIALILFTATLPAFIAQTHYSRFTFRLQSWRAPETRRMNYYEHLLTVDASAKEIKLFGLGDSLLKRHADLFWGVFKEDQALAFRRSWVSVSWGVVSSLSYYSCYGWVVLKTVAQAITLGQMTMYLVSFRQIQATFSGFFDNLSKLFENGLFMQNLFEFLELAEPTRQTENSDAISKKVMASGIEFRNVSFRYPSQDSTPSPWVIRGFNLTVGPGEKIALVGENGSGKTTLIKLLTRLYDPTEGEIFLNGESLRDYSVEDLHRRLGVIFQDFVRYQLTLRENVGFGSIENLDDQDKLTLAAAKGGADDLVETSKEGWNTMLGGWFQKGRELSGGQWQKVALSRAFMRESEVIILDEPTSALDAAKEHEVFERFKEFTKGKIAFLISHRFSTVRMADKIIVLKNGQIEESGSHKELMSLNGTYARLFELQANAYR